ncbi:MAG: efflux RND transporter permease subunit [Hyphomicrobiales bacterium]
MKLPKYAVDNIQFTTIIFIVLLILGLNSFFSMPRTEDPPVNGNACTVVVIYPGANPKDLEQLIADPIEDGINELDEIKKIKTELRDGLCFMNIYFDNRANSEKVYDKVTEKLNNLKNDLPEDIYDMLWFPWESTDTKVFTLAMISDSVPYCSMEEYSENLKKALNRIKSIKKVDVDGYPKQTINILMDMEKMAGMNIDFTDVIKAIQSENQNIPGGGVIIGGNRFSIQTSGSYKDIEGIRNTIVSSYLGRLIYLKNIAKIEQGYEDEKYKARHNGHRAIFVSATQKDGFNIFDTFDQIYLVVDEFKSTLDPNVHMEYVLDQSIGVSHRINQFLLNLLEGIILVGIVIIFAIGIRSSLIIMTAIPLSIIVGLFFVDISGYGLQQISIGGLVLALGLLVDNSIVVVENVDRFKKSGLGSRESAIKGASQVGWPVISSTVTTILAFIPILMIEGVAGDFVRSLPTTVIYVLAASLLISLTLSPLLSSSLLSKGKSQRESRLQKLLNKIINGSYQNTLNYVLVRRKRVLFVTLLIFIGAIFLFSFGITKSFFPKAEKPEFLININAATGSSLDNTNDIAKEIETYLDTLPEIKSYSTAVGHGFPKVYYNQGESSFDPSLAVIYVEVNNYHPKRLEAVVNKIRKHYANYSGAKIEVKEFEQGAPVDAPITLRVTGKNLNILQKIASDIADTTMNTVGAVNVNNQLDKSQTDIKVNINKDKALQLGIPLSIIDYAIRTAVNGNPISDYRDKNGKQFDIILRQDFHKNVHVNIFKKIWIKSLSGRMIPLNEVTNLEFDNSPALITRYNKERCAAILSDVKKGYSANAVTQTILDKLENYKYPEGYRLIVEGDTEQMKESFGSMGIAAIIALIAIFAVLVLQFKSLLQPLIIYSAIPLAVIGSFVALYITGNYFSFTAFIGLTSLIGIVINNSIILVDYTNLLVRKEKHKIIDAVIKAGKIRFTPIILTTLTTIGGLLPLTLTGGPIWAPLGWTIIGGLAFSTFLTLIIVPILYSIFTK